MPALISDYQGGELTEQRIEELAEYLEDLGRQLRRSIVIKGDLTREAER